MTTGSETGHVTGTKDKTYNILWYTEACLDNVLRLETYIQDAERDGDRELAEFFRKAQADSRKGALPVHRKGVVPGHEAVGLVAGMGAEVTGFAEGDRVGVAWLRRTDGVCRYCTRGAENLCPNSRYTGWDADGGYAEYLTVPAPYAYHLHDGYPDDEVAPLLCAGIIGYRALRRANLPPGGRLGIYGFGASAHLTAELAIAQGATVHVLTRSTAAQRLARSLGAASAGNADAAPPEPLDAAILFAPVGDLVPVALPGPDPGA